MYEREINNQSINQSTMHHITAEETPVAYVQLKMVFTVIKWH